MAKQLIRSIDDTSVKIKCKIALKEQSSHHFSKILHVCTHVLSYFVIVQFPDRAYLLFLLKQRVSSDTTGYFPVIRRSFYCVEITTWYAEDIQQIHNETEFPFSLIITLFRFE